nr:RNA polymerase sporulation sigma factor SigK [Maliibacterium massiliense]
MIGIMQWLQSVCFLVSYVSNGGSFPRPLTSEEERACLERFAKGDEEARQMLVEHNLRLVAHIAKKYAGNGRDMDDLISSGTIGLIKAVSTFKQGRGTQLATYAARCIENEILMSIRAQKKYRNDISLQEPIGTDHEGNEISLIDILGTDADAVIDTVEQMIRSGKLQEAVRTLEMRERVVMEMRYGLNKKVPMTQRDVGKALGISRSYVSRIEKKAVEKLKKKFEHPAEKRVRE